MLINRNAQAVAVVGASTETSSKFKLMPQHMGGSKWSEDGGLSTNANIGDTEDEYFACCRDPNSE